MHNILTSKVVGKYTSAVYLLGCSENLQVILYIFDYSYKKINQSVLKEISPEYSMEGLMLKLKLQYFGHLI